MGDWAGEAVEPRVDLTTGSLGAGLLDIDWKRHSRRLNKVLLLALPFLPFQYEQGMLQQMAAPDKFAPVAANGALSLKR